MNRCLIDTNILIYASKADEKAVTFMRQLFNDKTKDFLCSVITEAELFSKTTSNEVKDKMEALLNEAIKNIVLYLTFTFILSSLL